MYFTEMGADRVVHHRKRHARASSGAMPGCGPTQIVRFGPSRLRGRLPSRPGDGRGVGRGRHRPRASPPDRAASRCRTQRRGERRAGRGIFFRRRQFDLTRPATGRVYHLNAMGVMTEVVGGHQIRQWRQLRSGRPHALCVGASGAAHPGAHSRRPPARDGDAGAADFAQHDATKTFSLFRRQDPTVWSCAPDCWRPPNTARAACICSTATASTSTR